MIDLENDLYAKIQPVLTSHFQGIELTGEELINAPSKFPCVSIFEADNYPVVKTQDSGSNENHVHLMYEVNIYTNKADSKKGQAKKILNVLDGELNKLGFTRTMKQPASLNDGQIFRFIARYEAIADKDHKIYRR